MADCEGFLPDGSPCKTPALTGERWCLWHHQNPDIKAKAHSARIAGGLARRQADTIGDFPGKIETIQQLLDFVNRALEESWALPSTEKRLRMVGMFLRIAVDVLPIQNMNSRLELLENLFYSENSNASNKNPFRAN